MLVFHSMMHFWNSYEIPAYYSGRLTALHPRIWTCPGVPTIGTTPGQPNGAAPNAGTGSAANSDIAGTHGSPARERGRANSSGTPGITPTRRGSGTGSTGSGGSGRQVPPSHAIPFPLPLPLELSSGGHTTSSSSASPGVATAHTPHSALLERVSADPSASQRARSNSTSAPPLPVPAAPGPASLAFSSIYESVEARRARLAAATAAANAKLPATGTAASSHVHHAPPPPPVIAPPSVDDSHAIGDRSSLKYNRNRSSSEGTASTWQQYQSTMGNGGVTGGSSGEGQDDDDFGFFMEEETGPRSPLVVSKSGKHVLKNPPSWDQWGRQVGGSNTTSTGAGGNSNSNTGPGRGMVQNQSEKFNIFGVDEDD